MKIKDGFVIRPVMGSYVVIATGEMSKSFHGMVKLNGTAKDIWELLERGLDEDGIVKAMSDSYEVDEDTLRADVKKTVAAFVAQGFVEV